MARFLLALIGVVLLAVAALALIWLLGQLFHGLGLLAVGAAVVLFKLLWFLVLTGFLALLVYFVTSAWRPATRTAAQRAVAPVKPAKPMKTAAQSRRAPDPEPVKPVEADA